MGIETHKRQSSFVAEQERPHDFSLIVSPPSACFLRTVTVSKLFEMRCFSVLPYTTTIVSNSSMLSSHWSLVYSLYDPVVFTVYVQYHVLYLHDYLLRWRLYTGATERSPTTGGVDGA